MLLLPLTFNHAGRWSADLPFGFRRGGDGRSGLRFVLDHGGSEAVRGAAGFVGAALESDRGFLPLTINRTGMLCGFCCLRWAPEMRLGGSSASAGGVACGIAWVIVSDKEKDALWAELWVAVARWLVVCNVLVWRTSKSVAPRNFDTDRSKCTCGVDMRREWGSDRGAWNRKNHAQLLLQLHLPITKAGCADREDAQDRRNADARRDS